MVINIIINCETLIAAVNNSKINRPGGYLIYIHNIVKYIGTHIHSAVKMEK